jgi:NitT/TauT family transport system substrate-binding protein/sulfonate transport system substrate-binding protein
MITRRSVFASGLAACLVTAASPGRAAQDKVLRVGFQKGEPILLAARENHTLETVLQPMGIAVQWLEFQFGPPMLEAMRVGSIDVGGVGDTPPVFAQAAHADLVYIAAQRAGGSAILLPPGSKLQTLQDLKGRRVAFGRGSSAHNLTVAALEKAGLRYDEIQPIYLGPADAGAAFERGAIDAWTVWDPYYALVEAHPGVRVLAKWTDITEQNSFFIARRAYAEGNPATVARIVAAFVEVSTWARAHRSVLADRLAAATGLSDDAMQRSVGRAPFEVFAMNDEVMAGQQTVADRFLRIGVIPERIQIADAVWRAPRA